MLLLLLLQIRHLTVADRAPLRTAGPHWDETFFTYLREMDCPYDLKPVAAGDEITDSTW